eukprot:753945-Hanusia_phi.AAC.3
MPECYGQGPQIIDIRKQCDISYNANLICGQYIKAGWVQYSYEESQKTCDNSASLACRNILLISSAGHVYGKGPPARQLGALHKLWEQGEETRDLNGQEKARDRRAADKYQSSYTKMFPRVVYLNGLPDPQVSRIFHAAKTRLTVRTMPPRQIPAVTISKRIETTMPFFHSKHLSRNTGDGQACHERGLALRHKTCFSLRRKELPQSGILVTRGTREDVHHCKYALNQLKVIDGLVRDIETHGSCLGRHLAQHGNSLSREEERILRQEEIVEQTCQTQSSNRKR